MLLLRDDPSPWRLLKLVADPPYLSCLVSPLDIKTEYAAPSGPPPSSNQGGGGGDYKSSYQETARSDEVSPTSPSSDIPSLRPPSHHSSALGHDHSPYRYERSINVH